MSDIDDGAISLTEQRRRAARRICVVRSAAIIIAVAPWLGVCGPRPSAPAPVATAEPPVTVQSLPPRRRSIDCHPTARRPDRPGAEHDRHPGLPARAAPPRPPPAPAPLLRPAAAMPAPPPPRPPAPPTHARTPADAGGCGRDARRRILALSARHGRDEERTRSGRNPGPDLPPGSARAVAKIAIAAGGQPARRYCTASSRRNR